MDPDDASLDMARATSAATLTASAAGVGGATAGYGQHRDSAGRERRGVHAEGNVGPVLHQRPAAGLDIAVTDVVPDFGGGTRPEHLGRWRPRGCRWSSARACSRRATPSSARQTRTTGPMPACCWPTGRSGARHGDDRAISSALEPGRRRAAAALGKRGAERVPRHHRGYREQGLARPAAGRAGLRDHWASAPGGCPWATLGPIASDALPSASPPASATSARLRPGSAASSASGRGSPATSARRASQPGLSGSDAYTHVRPFCVVWVRRRGRPGGGLRRDAGRQHLPQRARATCITKWDVGEFEAGAAFMWYGVRLSYTQTWQTQEFRHARSGLFNFGSLAASVRF